MASSFAYGGRLKAICATFLRPAMCRFMSGAQSVASHKQNLVSLPLSFLFVLVASIRRRSSVTLICVGYRKPNMKLHFFLLFVLFRRFGVSFGGTISSVWFVLNFPIVLLSSHRTGRSQLSCLTAFTIDFCLTRLSF